MNLQEFKQLLTRALIVQDGKRPISIRKTYNEDSLTVRIMNWQDKVIKLKALYISKFNTIKVITYTNNKYIGTFTRFVMCVDELRELEENNISHEEYNKGIYNIDEIIERLNDGRITIDVRGHNIGLKGSNQWFIDNLKEKIIGFKETAIERSKVDFWLEKKDKNRTPEEIEKDLRTAQRLSEDYANWLTKKIKKYESLYPGFASSSEGEYCHNCGQRHQLMLLDENTISLKASYEQKNNGQLEHECMFSNGLNPKEVILNMPSGNIVIANYFNVEGAERRESTVYDPEESFYDEFSVSTHKGRIARMKKLAENNIGYGQMGNMSMAIYVNPTKDKIIIGDAYPEDWEEYGGLKEPKDYTKAKKENFIKIGDVSLSLWAYYLVDQENMIKYNTAPLEDGYDKVIESKNITKDNDSYADRIIANMQSGDWKLTHYYDNTPDPENGRLFTYATLELVK